ncbi:MAG TPA: beta-Ala-His dipeptidase, partial [Thermoplasmata archaeon]|nr:beta-Ala-His dipeptidase [Thermoplasmata archaeon]
MSEEYSKLEPPLVWKYFREVSNIPRCSKHEEKVAEYIISVAKKLGLEYKQDEAGNIVVRKPATPGKENCKGVVLQCHLDMVCEKNEDVIHDFSKDPIKFVIKGDYLYADGTTLGADNGIGVATALAILEDKEVVHSPLEVLFTVDEETGLTGAFQLKPDFLNGRRLINLDSEEDGVIYIGCAGGADTKLFYKGRKLKPAKNLEFLKVTLKGLKGGHSGIDINQGRGNAVQLLARALFRAREKVAFYLLDYRGGNKRNAIARECSAVVGLTAANLKRFKRLMSKEFEKIKSEYRVVEKDITYQFEKASEP